MASEEGEHADFRADIDIDIVIVGAGPAGLYTAWSLLQHPSFKNQKICVYDAAERTGGRVLSIKLPDIPFIAELGAMRYIPEQFLISRLIEHLGLPTDTFKFETSGYRLRTQDFSENLFNGEITTVKSDLPYRGLTPAEQGKGPGKLIELAILRALKQDLQIAEVSNADGNSVNELRDKLKSLNEDSPPSNFVQYFEPHEWLFIRQYGRVDGEFLYETGFWDLVQQHLSEDAYNLANDGSGYQSILSMWNAADAILWYLADFACSEYRTIHGGMTQLIDRLGREVAQLGKNAHPNLKVINLGCELQQISALVEKGQKKYRLLFEQGRYVTDAGAPSPLTVDAKKVILALPQPALKNLQIEGLFLQGKPNESPLGYFHELLDDVTANPLFKAFAFFKEHWWPEEKENRCFRVYTDLQLRQVYHLGKERLCSTIPTQHDREKMCAVLLYSDARYADYWGNLDRMGDENERVYMNEFRSKLNDADREIFDLILRNYGTSDLLQHRIRAYLKQISGKQPPKPITVILKNWASPPTYAGWHSWNMGARSWITSERLVRPFLTTDLEAADIFTCGEAFSSEQGWIEGALKSSERVLERLGLNEPLWIKETDRAAYRTARELWVQRPLSDR